MAKKKSKRRNFHRKSNLVPLLAIGVGVYLLTLNRGKVPKVETNLPTLPGAQPSGSGTAIGIRPDRRRYINTYI